MYIDTSRKYILLSTLLMLLSPFISNGKGNDIVVSLLKREAISNDTILRELKLIDKYLENPYKEKMSGLLTYNNMQIDGQTLTTTYKKGSWAFYVQLNPSLSYIDCVKDTILRTDENESTIFEEIRFFHEKYMLKINAIQLKTINQAFAYCLKNQTISFNMHSFLSEDKKRNYLCIETFGFAKGTICVFIINESKLYGCSFLCNGEEVI